MYGVIRQYKIDPDQIGAIVRHCREPFLPNLSKTLGFVSWTLMDAGPTLLTASAFDDEIEADNAAGWYRENQAALALGKPRVTRGPVVVYHVAEHVPAGYGLVWRCTFKTGDAERATQRLCDIFLPGICDIPHFASYEVIAAGGGNVVSLCAFTDRESAEEGKRRTVAWASENLAGSFLNVPEIIVCEIRLRTAKIAEADDRAAPIYADA